MVNILRFVVNITSKWSIFHQNPRMVTAVMPHFPKMCISQDLKVNIVNARFSRKFCGRYLVDKVLCGRYLVDIRFFFWWSIFDKTPLAGLHLSKMVNYLPMVDIIDPVAGLCVLCSATSIQSSSCPFPFGSSWHNGACTKSHCPLCTRKSRRGEVEGGGGGGWDEGGKGGRD